MVTRRLRASLRTTVLLLVLGLATSACGGEAAVDDRSQQRSPTPTATASSPAAAGTDPAVFPVSVSADNGEVTIPARPERIVSLSPTATEMLFAIGAGDQVVAVDEFSDHPEDAPTTDLSGFTPNLEAILNHEPDLVVAESGPEDLVTGLAAAEVPVIVQGAAANIDHVYGQMETLGVATGHVAEAAEVVAGMQTEIAEIVADVEPADEPVSYYHELDPTYFTVTSDTFIGELYRLLGMKSIADAAAEDGNPYPQLNEEFIVEADPDLILLADTQCCGVTPEQVAERPGWDTITAVENDAIVVLDEDVASRWGPRVVEFLRAVADHLASLQPAG